MDDMTTSESGAGTVRLVPGTAVAVIGGTVAALVADDPRSDLVKRLHARIAAGVTLDELVEALVAEGVRHLPSFGLVSWTGDEARLIVRGDVGALLEPTSTGPVSSVVAGDVTTWVERAEPGVRAVQLHLVGDLSELGAFETQGGLLPACRIEVRHPQSGDVAERPESDLVDLVSGVRSDTEEARVVDDPAASDSSDASDVRAVAGETNLPAPAEPPSLPEPPALPEPPVLVGPRAEEPDEPGEPAQADELGDAGGPESSWFEVAPPSAETDVEPAPPSTDPDVDAAASPDEPESKPSSLDTLIGPFDLESGEDEVDDEGPLTSEVAGDGSETPEAEVDDYDHLFGATQFRTVEDAAVRSSDVVEQPSAGPEALISSIPGPDTAGVSVSVADVGSGDHDGHTISLSALQAARARVGLDNPPSTRAGAALPAPPAGAPMVHAVRCRGGHLNPPHATNCRVCDALIGTQEHVTVPRPVLGVLRFSDGRTLFLSGPMLIGRSPRADGAVGGEPPELVAVASPLKEISGTHLEVRIEGWQVFLVDRQSTNGTVATLPGRDAQRLHPGEPFLITPGTSVNLADEIEFRFEASV